MFWSRVSMVSFPCGLFQERLGFRWECTFENLLSSMTGARSARAFVFYHKQAASGVDCRHEVLGARTLNLVTFQLQMDIRGPWAVPSGMACFACVRILLPDFQDLPGLLPHCRCWGNPDKGWVLEEGHPALTRGGF